jgi:hypothetical protein
MQPLSQKQRRSHRQRGEFEDTVISPLKLYLKFLEKKNK